jgi:hypothetical protein
VKVEIREALGFHLEGIRKNGLPSPAVESEDYYLEERSAISGQAWQLISEAEKLALHIHFRRDFLHETPSQQALLSRLFRRD